MSNKARPSYHSPVPGDHLLPVIGLTTYREDAQWGVWHERADLLPSTYADATAAAGGVPVLLPPAVDGDEAFRARGAVSAVDGLVLAGGADVEPSRYGARPDPHTGSPRPDRDSWELALVRAALDRDLPVLAICRGIQVLNVALGGSLLQHLPDVVGHMAHCPVVGEHGRHDVALASESAIADLLGTRVTVATYHHQAVDALGRDLVAVGWADDGTIEAVEHASASWVVGVQWHPEAFDGAALFRGFVAACADYRSRTVVGARA